MKRIITLLFLTLAFKCFGIFSYPTSSFIGLGIAPQTNGFGVVSNLNADGSVQVLTNGATFNAATATVATVATNIAGGYVSTNFLIMPTMNFTGIISNAPAGSTIICSNGFYQAGYIFVPQGVKITGISAPLVIFSFTNIPNLGLAGPSDFQLSDNDTIEQITWNAISNATWGRFHSVAGMNANGSGYTNVLFNKCTLNGNSDVFDCGQFFYSPWEDITIRDCSISSVEDIVACPNALGFYHFQNCRLNSLGGLAAYTFGGVLDDTSSIWYGWGLTNLQNWNAIFQQNNGPYNWNGTRFHIPSFWNQPFATNLNVSGYIIDDVSNITYNFGPLRSSYYNAGYSATNVVFTYNTNIWYGSGSAVAADNVAFVWNQAFGGWTNANGKMIAENVNDGGLVGAIGTGPLANLPGNADYETTGFNSIQKNCILNLNGVAWSPNAASAPAPTGFFATNTIATNYVPILGVTLSTTNIGGTFTGNGNSLTNLNAANITGLTNSINSSMTYKDAVNEATTTGLPAYTYNNSAQTITGTSIGGLTIDGITVQQGDNVLVKNEATAATNGVYVCTSVGSLIDYVLTRRADFNAATNITAGDTVYCIQGTANTNTTWTMNTAGAITVGTTPLNFVQIAGATTLTGAVTGSGVGTIATTAGNLAGGTNLSASGISTNGSSANQVLTSVGGHTVWTNAASGGAGTNVIPFFNVKTYGAVGDGTTLDFTAISNAVNAINANGGGVLYFPATPKGYNLGTNDTLLLETNITIMGDGEGHYGVMSYIVCNETNQPIMLATNCWFVAVKDIEFFDNNTNYGTSLFEQNANYLGGTVHMNNVEFYNGGLLIECCDIGVFDTLSFAGQNAGANPYGYSFSLLNSINADDGDHTIVNSWFNQNAGEGLYVLSSGGIKMSNCKFNGGTGFGYQYPVYLTPFGGTTSILLIDNCSFENFFKTGIELTTGDGTSGYSLIGINNCEFLSESSSINPDISLNYGIGNNATIANILDSGHSSDILTVNGVTNVTAINFISTTGSNPVYKEGANNVGIYYNFVAQ